MQFEFGTATRIIFGPGRVNSIGKLVDGIGKRALILAGGPKDISDRLVNLLEPHGVTCSFITINQEPTIDRIRELVELANQMSPDFVIGIGGGSTIDSAKATAAMLTNSGDVTDYLEIIGLNRPLLNPSLPLIAIPTTAGTGSEVTRNAVLDSPSNHIKVSLRSSYLFPRISLVDPELTLSVPSEITAYTGLDALTQLIEPFTCLKPNPLTDALCIEGIQHVARSLFQAYDHGDDIHAREDMSIASLFSGLALANAKLGAVHGMAAPIGGEIRSAHGAICAVLLPHVMEANLKALTERTPNHPVLDRYTTISKILSGNSEATAEMGIQWVHNFCKHAKIPQLSTYGLSKESFGVIIENSMKASSMKGNPIILSEPELRNILQKSL